MLQLNESLSTAECFLYTSITKKIALNICLKGLVNILKINVLPVSGCAGLDAQPG